MNKTTTKLIITLVLIIFTGCTKEPDTYMLIDHPTFQKEMVQKKIRINRANVEKLNERTALIKKHQIREFNITQSLVDSLIATDIMSLDRKLIGISIKNTYHSKLRELNSEWLPRIEHAESAAEKEQLSQEYNQLSDLQHQHYLLELEKANRDLKN